MIASVKFLASENESGVAHIIPVDARVIPTLYATLRASFEEQVDSRVADEVEGNNTRLISTAHLVRFARDVVKQRTALGILAGQERPYVRSYIAPLGPR